MVCSRVTEACFTKGEARTDFLLCAPCTPVPRAFGRVNYSGSYLYSSLLEGDVERWRHVLYFKLYIPCREVNLASRHCLQLFSLHFSCCTFLFLCPFVQHLIIFMPLISVLQILTLKENKHTLKKIYLFPIICPDSFSLSLQFSPLWSADAVSLRKCAEWNILVLLQSILWQLILPDAHFPLNFPIIIPCFLPAAVGMFWNYQRISLFSLLSSFSTCRALRCYPFPTIIPCNLESVTLRQSSSASFAVFSFL